MVYYSLRKYIKQLLKTFKLGDNPKSIFGIDFEERRRLLKNTTKKIAFAICDGESDTARYRCLNVMNATLDSKEWQLVFFDVSELKKVRDFFKKTDLLVIVRMPYFASVNSIINTMHKKGRRVLYDVDDLICDNKSITILLDGLGVEGKVERKYWSDLVGDYNKMALKTDGFLCTNDYLGGKLERSFGKPYKVIPNSLNKEQVGISEKCLAKKKHDGFKIGYFSGSPTHVRDFQLVEPELIKFLDEHKDAMLEVVGYMDFSDEMRKLIDAGRVKVRELVGYLELQKLMAEVDVNIAPLLVNDFTNCKSELKFFEAAAVETTTIASPTYAFKKAISDGENGFLAEPHEWHDKLEYLYKHPEENKKVAKKARKYVLKHYYGKEFLKEVEEAYDYFTK